MLTSMIVYARYSVKIKKTLKKKMVPCQTHDGRNKDINRKEKANTLGKNEDRVASGWKP